MILKGLQFERSADFDVGAVDRCLTLQHEEATCSDDGFVGVDMRHPIFESRGWFVRFEVNDE